MRAVALLGAAALAACAGTGGTAADRADLGRWMPIEPAMARVQLAPNGEAGAAVAARELRTTQGELVQEVTLANPTAIPGQNALTLMVDYGPPSLFAVDHHAPKVGRYAMTPAVLAAATREALAGAAPEGQPEMRANRYGPYSYVAAGQPGGVRCVYAWQGLEGGTAAFGASFRRAAVTLRVCDRARRDEDLLSLFDGLSFAP